MENLLVERNEAGKVTVSFTAALPTPSVEENAKYPFTQWNQKEAEKFVGKACDRLLQAIANQDYVTARVASRTASRAEERGKKKLERLQSELAAAQAAVGSRGSLPQAEAAAVPAPASEIPAAAPRRPAARKSAKGGRR